MSDQTVADIKQRLQQSPKKSLCKLSQETGLSYSTCQSGKEGKVEGLPCYRHPGIKAVRYTQENGILQMVHESLWRRRRTAGHNMVFR